MAVAIGSSTASVFNARPERAAAVSRGEPVFCPGFSGGATLCRTRSKSSAACMHAFIGSF